MGPGLAFSFRRSEPVISQSCLANALDLRSCPGSWCISWPLPCPHAYVTFPITYSSRSRLHLVLSRLSPPGTGTPALGWSSKVDQRSLLFYALIRLCLSCLFTLLGCLRGRAY